MEFLDAQNRLIAAPEPIWIRSPKRVRVRFGGETIADSTQARLFRPGGPPVYYFPRADVRQDALAPGGRSEPGARGTMTRYDVRAGGRFAEGAAWEHAKPADEFAFLAGMVAFEWGAMDAWFEEEEQVFVHARDPFKRVEALKSSRRVEIHAAGEKVADSAAPTLLIEPGHPPRYYLPKTHVRMDLLRPSLTISRCAYKGEADYYSVRTPSGEVEDAAWRYKRPMAEVAGVAGMLCFFDERVDAVIVDGQEQPKPATAWRR